MNKCSKCAEWKEINNFSPRNNRKKGYQPSCKACTNAHKRKYRKSKIGVIARIFENQISHSQSRKHAAPTYNKQELKEWLYAQPLFHKLYDNWKRLDYQKWYIPSVDRKNDYIGYTLDNIQLMTWQENSDKGSSDRKTGKNNKQSRTVLQYSLKNNFIKEFYSIAEAARQTETANGNIIKCCNGKLKKANNFIWKYKKEK